MKCPNNLYVLVHLHQDINYCSYVTENGKFRLFLLLKLEKF